MLMNALKRRNGEKRSGGGGEDTPLLYKGSDNCLCQDLHSQAWVRASSLCFYSGSYGCSPPPRVPHQPSFVSPVNLGHLFWGHVQPSCPNLFTADPFPKPSTMLAIPGRHRRE